MTQLELIQGNCLSVMNDLISKNFRCKATITSPPYNMNLRIRNGKYCSRQIVKEISTKYTNFDDNLSIDQLYNFNEKVINKLLKVSDLIFYNIQILTGNKPAFFKLIGKYHDKIKEIIIWDKINAQPAIAKNVMNSRFEILLVLSEKNSINRSFETANFERGTLDNLWQIKKGKKVSKSHGAVFPIELVNKIIKNFTNEDDTIFDPFMGTGTTGESSLMLNRRFVGVEIDKDYYNFSKERLQGLLL